jgi:hypothetical protein
MKKFQFTILLIVSLVSATKAQFLESGIAATLVTPAGDFSNAVGTGYGGVFMAKFGLPILDITGSVEYLRFSEKEVGSVKFNSTMWGINAGARISVFPFISAGAEIGNYWVTVTTDDGTGEHDNTENKIAFTPLVAAQFSMFEASIRYALIDNASFFSIRAGIYF